MVGLLRVLETRNCERDPLRISACVMHDLELLHASKGNFNVKKVWISQFN